MAPDLDHPAGYLVELLGPPPAEAGERRAWAWAAEWVEAYRHQVAVTDGSALGARPSGGLDGARYDEVVEILRAYARDHRAHAPHPCGAPARS